MRGARSRRRALEYSAADFLLYKFGLRGCNELSTAALVLASLPGSGLLVSESTGALSRAVTTLLSCLAKAVRAPEGHDSTVYGTGRASTKSFYTHHVAAISSAIVRADALLVRNAAASLAFQLAHAPGPS